MQIALILCAIALIILIIKLITLKNSLRELGREFSRHSDMDSNTVICVNTMDRDVRSLAGSLNTSLGTIRDKYRTYSQGDLEVKRMITNISHDLRTPLTAILGYLSMLKDCDDPEVARRYLNIIENRSKRMKELTTELFEYSLITADEAEKPLELSEVSINKVLEDTILNFYAALSDKGIQPQIDITEKEIIRMLNPEALERVFANLISNVLKYSLGDLKISLNDEGVVVFSNMAPGLTALDVEKLFDRFYTVQSSSMSTGVGLSIVKSFVTKMNGQIRGDYANGELSITIKF